MRTLTAVGAVIAGGIIAAATATTIPHAAAEFMPGEPTVPITDASLGLYQYPDTSVSMSIVQHADGSIERQGCDGSVFPKTGQLRYETDVTPEGRQFPSGHFDKTIWVGPADQFNRLTPGLGRVYMKWKHSNVPKDNVHFTNVPPGSLNSGWEDSENGVNTDQFAPGTRVGIKVQLVDDGGHTFNFTCTFTTPVAP